MIPDGISIVWYLRTFKDYLLERIDSFKFFYEFSKIANEKIFLFFVGGHDKNISLNIEHRLMRDFSNIRISDFIQPSFMESFSDDIDDLIVEKQIT